MIAIIHSFLPLPTRREKEQTTYNAREKSNKKCGAQEGHKGITLTKQEVKNKIENGDLQYKVVTIGKQEGDYISRYVLDLQILPTATELRFYADESGKIVIPKEYQSDVIYGPGHQINRGRSL